MCNHPGALGAKHTTPSINDGASCACLRVRFDPVTHPDGSKTERWRCKDCGARFIRGEQMPGPIVPSDFTSDDVDDDRLPLDDDRDLLAVIRDVEVAASLAEEPDAVQTMSRVVQLLRELDDLRRIAYDLHSLAAAAWQHIRATAPDDKQRDEANAVCDKLLEGGPLWLCSLRIPAVGSGMCTVATVGIAEANRDRARMMTVGFPLWKLALELAREIADLDDRMLGSPAAAEAPRLKQGREALRRLTEGGDLFWLGEGDKDAQAWGLLQLGTVRCAGCGHEITPPAHLVARGGGDERLAPLCNDCWDFEATTELEQQDPNAQPRTDGDAVSPPGPAPGPSGPAPASQPPHGPLPHEECSCCGGSGRDPEVPDDEPHPGWPCLSCWGSGKHHPDEPEVLAIARCLRKARRSQQSEERFRDAERGSFWWIVGELIRAALYDRRVTAQQPDELALLRHRLRLADHAINVLCVHAGPEQQRKWSSRDAVRAYLLSLPHPITGDHELPPPELREAAQTLVDAMGHDWPPNGADGVGDAIEGLRHALKAPPSYRVIGIDWAAGGAVAAVAPSPDDFSHELYDAERPAWNAVRHVVGPYAPALIAGAHLLAALPHYPEAVASLELAIERCRAGSEPFSLNDLAARVLEAVLAQHEVDDG